MNMERKRKGFTLAEVLISLGIIGVVAAMTIPTLISSYQKTQYVTGFKKAYSELSQALIKLTVDYDCAGKDLKCTNLFNSSVTPVGDALVKQFNVAKNCKNSTGCFPDDIEKANYNYDGSGSIVNYNWVFTGGSTYDFITADGMVFGISVYSNNCSESRNKITQICALAVVDVNGIKGPNHFGRDIFELFITDSQGPTIRAAGVSDDSSTWNTSGKGCNTTDHYGETCAGRIVEEGWQMKY